MGVGKPSLQRVLGTQHLLQSRVDVLELDAPEIVVSMDPACVFLLLMQKTAQERSGQCGSNQKRNMHPMRVGDNEAPAEGTTCVWGCASITHVKTKIATFNFQVARTLCRSNQQTVALTT